MARNKQYTPLGRKIALLAKNQLEIAQVLGLTQQSVSGKLCGKIGITLPDIELLSRHFDVPKIYFLAPEEVTPEQARTFERFLSAPSDLYEALNLALDMPESIAGPLLQMVRVMKDTVSLCATEIDKSANENRPAFLVSEYIKD